MKEQTISPAAGDRGKNHQEHGSWLTLLLCMAVLLVFTLKPFWFTVESKGWDHDFYPRDLFQNVVLFLPLGMILRRSFSLSIGVIALIGAAFSLSIEMAQLYTPQRFSNPLDILCNTLGALIGGIIAGWAFPTPADKRLSEVMMTLLLLCWTAGMSAKVEPLSRYVVVCFSAAGVAAFFNGHKLPRPRRWLALLFWSAFSSAFFFYSLRFKALLILPPLLLVNALFMRATTRHSGAAWGARVAGGLLLIAALLMRYALHPFNWDVSLRAVQVLLLIHLIGLTKRLPSAA